MQNIYIYIFSFDHRMQYVLHVILTDLIHFVHNIFWSTVCFCDKKSPPRPGQVLQFCIIHQKSFQRKSPAGSLCAADGSFESCYWAQMKLQAHRRLNDTPLSHTTPQYLSETRKEAEGFTEPVRRGSLGWNWGQKR